MTINEKITYLAEKQNYDFEDLISIMEVLRSESGCPWDREQNHKSIRKDFIEETYEVIEAIDTDNATLLREELGDVLLQVAFHSQIEAEKNCFDIHDVVHDICVKLVHRHPHVFGTVCADTTDKVLSNWEQIKSEEKSRNTVTDKLRAVPPMLPALMRAEKIGKKAKMFDFADAREAMDKVSEEWMELQSAMAEDDRAQVEEEIGDLLFSMVSLCRKMKIDPEICLNQATDKFIDRFEIMENAVLQSGRSMENLSQEQLDVIWNENKHKKTRKK